MQFSPLRRVRSSLLGEKVDKVPVTSLAGCGGTVTVDMQKNTGIYWPEAHKDPKKMAQLSIACPNLTGIENIRVPFDFVVEPEAMGCETKWWSNIEAVPSVIKHPYKSPQDLKIPENLLELGRIPTVLEAIKITRDKVGDYLPISSLVLGPFSLAGELAGFEDFLRWTIKKPEYVKKLVKITTEIVIEYAKAQYQAGSHIVEVAEPMASLESISGGMFKEYVKPHLIRIASKLKGVKLLHICGYTKDIVPDIVETGFNGISLNVDIKHLKPLVGQIKILGNISSKETLVIGSPNEVKAEAKKALEEGVDLLEPECGISPVTPTKNLKAIIEARDEFYNNH